MSEPFSWPPNWLSIKKELLSALQYLLTYLINPVQGIRKIPDWQWPTQVIILGGLSAISGMLSAIVNKSFLGIFAGLIFYPISTLVVVTIISGFFYYVSLFIFSQTINFQKTFCLVVLASIPTLLMNILSPLLIIAGLLGLAASSLLLLIGLVENFHLPKKPIMKIILGLFATYFIMWILGLMMTARETRILKESPRNQKSLDILESELRGR